MLFTILFISILLLYPFSEPKCVYENCISSPKSSNGIYLFTTLFFNSNLCDSIELINIKKIITEEPKIY